MLFRVFSRKDTPWKILLADRKDNDSETYKTIDILHSDSYRYEEFECTFGEGPFFNADTMEFAMIFKRTGCVVFQLVILDNCDVMHRSEMPGCVQIDNSNKEIKVYPFAYCSYDEDIHDIVIKRIGDRL